MQALKVIQEQPVCREQMVPQARKVLKVPPGIMDLRVLPVHKVRLALMARGVRRARLVRKVRLAPMARQVCKVRLVRKVRLAPMARRVPRARQVRKVRLVSRVLKSSATPLR